MSSTTRTRTARLRGVAVNVLSALVSLLALSFILPAAFGMQRYVIAGESMTGTYNLGSVVFEEVVPAHELHVGDVITYMPPADSGIDHLVTHRIHTMRGEMIRTKGDANPDPDPWRFKLTAATQPRVVFGVPYVGFVFLALQNPHTRMLLIGGPAALVALLSLAELLGVLRPGRRDKASVAAAETSTAPAASEPATSIVLVASPTGRVPEQRLLGEADRLVGTGGPGR